MLQLIDKTGMALIASMVREIDRRKDRSLPYGDNIRALMIYLEGTVPGVAGDIRKHTLWERFQACYNEPDRDRLRKYGGACRDLFEQVILDVLFKFGYCEEQEDNFTIQIKKNGEQYHVTVCRPDNTIMAFEVYRTPLLALAGISAFETLFERT